MKRPNHPEQVTLRLAGRWARSDDKSSDDLVCHLRTTTSSWHR